MKYEKPCCGKVLLGKAMVITGPAKKLKRVECVSVVSGLMAHPSPSNLKADTVSISHSASGLYVISGIPETLLPTVITMLSAVSWEVATEVVYSTPIYFEIIRRIEYMLSSKDRSLNQEVRIADDFGGKRQPASGSRWGYRRDVITPEFLIEAKTTATSSYRLSDKDIQFLKGQAYEKGKIPLYIIELNNHAEVVVVPTQDIDPECVDTGKKRVFDKKNRKSFLVKEADVAFLNAGGTITIRLPSGHYTVLGYENFLTMAKKGVR